MMMPIRSAAHVANPLQWDITLGSEGMTNNDGGMDAGGVAQPLPRDITLGRGGMANNHVGNYEFRTIVAQYREEYLKTRIRADKARIIKHVFAHLREEGFRFVAKNSNGLWVEMHSFRKCRKKVAQALRQHSSKSQEMEGSEPSSVEEEQEELISSSHEPGFIRSLEHQHTRGEVDADNRDVFDPEPLPVEYSSHTEATESGGVDLDEEYFDFCMRLANGLEQPKQV